MSETTPVGEATSGSNYYAKATTKNNFDGRYTADSVIVTLSCALALYNCLEMVLLIATTFKRWKGLYFWSLTLCTLGVAGYTLGMTLVYFALGPLWLTKTLNDIGWLVMIITQSLVLYSRLNLIYDNERLLAAVKWMIICVSIFLPIPIVLDFGTTYSHDTGYARAYFYIEKLQMTGITVLELSISLLYVYKTVQLLRIISRVHMRSMIWQLFVLNIIIVVMDTAIVVLQYRHLQLYQESIKGFVYSVKLKLELNILSKLVDIVHGDRTSDRSMNLEVIDSNAVQVREREEVRRELADLQNMQQHGLGQATGIEKAAEVHINEKTGSSSTQRSSASPAPAPPSIAEVKEEEEEEEHDDEDELDRVITRQSTARTRGRESDTLYAEMLRSMK